MTGPRGVPGIRTATYPSIAEIGAARWDRLADRASLYQSRAYLAWVEAYHGLPARYVLATDAHGGPLGGVVTYLMRDVPRRLTTWYDPVRMFLAPHIDPGDAAQRWFPVLLVGGCSGYHAETLLAPGLDAPARAAVNRALLARCRELAAEQGAGTLAFMYAPKPQVEAVRRALGEATWLVPTSGCAVIELGPDVVDFEGYLARFPSARRSKIRKEVAAFTAAGAEVREYRLGDVLDRVIPLLGAHQRKYGDPTTDEQAGQLLRLQETYLGEHSSVFVDERDGRIHGFTLCFTHGDTVYSRAAGFDPERAAPFAYFNLAIYAPVRHAIAHKLAAVELGLGSYPGKLLRGARNQARWSAVLPPQPCEPRWLTALGKPSPQAVEAGCT